MSNPGSRTFSIPSHFAALPPRLCSQAMDVTKQPPLALRRQYGPAGITFLVPDVDYTVIPRSLDISGYSSMTVSCAMSPPTKHNRHLRIENAVTAPENTSLLSGSVSELKSSQEQGIGHRGSRPWLIPRTILAGLGAQSLELVNE